MTEYLIGTGGWAYFQIPGLHPLVAYSKAFNFVEVNSTFYEIPPLKQVEKWRRIVPQNFQFAVRAHQTITHKHHLQPTQETLENFEKIRKICDIIKSEIIHLQIPPSLKMGQVTIKNLRNLLSSVNLGKKRIVLEIRRTQQRMLPPELLKTMRDYSIIHCIDLSKNEAPAYKSNTLYSRLFGKGHHNIYQPTDHELKEIDKKASKGNFEKAILSFHFIKMYKDATRLKIYKKTGKFPRITRAAGLASLEEVLREDAHFPATKQELIHSQGWKLYEPTEEKRIHTRNALEKLPERKYSNINEVIDKLKSTTR